MQGSPLRKKPPQRTRHKPQRYEVCSCSNNITCNSYYCFMTYSRKRLLPSKTLRLHHKRIISKEHFVRGSLALEKAVSFALLNLLLCEMICTTAAKKIKATTVASEPQENVGTDCIASRTRQRRAVVTKAQISGPLELQDSPNLVCSVMTKFESCFSCTHSSPYIVEWSKHD